MAAKELRQSLRRVSFIVPFVAIHLFAVLAVASEFQMSQAFRTEGWNGMLNPTPLFSSGPFWIMVSIVCVLLMPLAGLGLMGQELEEGNHELLLLTKLDRWKVVSGKFITLWGLCALTFISLLPYVVVRYLVGGIEWLGELACSATVLGASAMLCAGAIGASGFKNGVIRLLVFALFLASLLGACAFPLVMSAMVSGGCGWWYHLTALMAIFCYVAIGLSLARSRLRLSVHPYEVNPSSLLMGVLIFAPFVSGLVTGASIGYGGGFALLGIGIAAIRMDRRTRYILPSPPLHNIPATGI